MADNYIERQYEQYEARKAAWEKKRKQGKKKEISVKPQPKDLTDNTIKLPRKAFITGGADGIGRNIVKAFCNSQYQVAFCDKNEDLGIQTAKETGAIFYHADVSNKESLENCMHELFEKWGDMDIIINNAGISEFSPITETSVEDFDKILSINLRPVFITSRTLALHRKSPVWQNYQYLFHPLFNERTGKRKLCGFQRRNLFTDPCTCFIPCRLSYHRKLYFAGMDSDQ